MGKKAQSVGKQWEQEIMDAYYKKGYQPFKLATEISGTCFDIILIRNAGCMCIEAKHIEGDKLYFKGCGLLKKKDEINHCTQHCSTNIYIFIKSDKVGTFWTTWSIAYPIFKEKGYLNLLEDCIPMEMWNVK